MSTTALYPRPVSTIWLHGPYFGYPGLLPVAHLHTISILAGWYFLGQDSGFPETNFDVWDPLDDTKNQHIDVRGDHWKVAREIAIASIVLLKNTRGALPLKNPRSIALIGSDASPPIRGPNGFANRGGSDGILAMGWGAGVVNFTYLISPLESVQERARRDGTVINWHFDDFDLVSAQNVALGTDVAFVFIKADSGEGIITVDGNVRVENLPLVSGWRLSGDHITIVDRRP